MTLIRKIRSKIIAKNKITEIISEWKNENLKIVFTNGCFDILHKGHIDYLIKASELGDRLVIGLNSDVSVRNLKGPGRPIQDEKTRAIILASLIFTGLVVLFDEQTPYELIKSIQPDILVKGKDYKPEEIAGADIVQNSGGEIVTIEFTKGYSSSSIIKRISNLHINAEDNGNLKPET